MDAHLEALLRVQLLQDLVHVPDGVVLAAVVVAHDAHDANRLVVDHVLELGWIDRERLPARRDEARLNVHVLEQLLPSRLEHRGDNEVWIDTPDLVLIHAVFLPVPLAPAELQRQTCQQASLRRAHGARAGVAAVRVKVWRLGAVPELCDHVQRVVVHLEGLRVHGLVGEVNPEPHGRNLLLLGLEDHVHVRAGVQALGEVQQVVVLNPSQAVTRSRAVLWQ
mmetsp:Transcript_38432/g.119600  ORF Transcript_38432/g.119600 Transcript_38432/m.119600 type:complete len:222 (-) Transcript_38432:145-810(-)